MMEQNSDSLLKERYVRLVDVITLTGLSRSSVFRLEALGEFPKRRRLGPRSVAWWLPEVKAWMKTRPCVTRE